jgi:hypothetical protein
MAGVIPDNYVNTEMVDNYCFDSCEFKYNYQPLDDFTLTKKESKYRIQISNPNNYKCKFSGEKYKLTDIYIILNSEDMQHRYERYETGTIIGEFIMSHKNENNPQTLNICMAIKDVPYDADNGDIMTPLTETLYSKVGLNLNDFIMSKPYNYYDSNKQATTDGKTDTHWIVFDYNQFVMLVNSSVLKDLTESSTAIDLPKAPSSISSIQYHERGPQFMEKSRQVNCTRISTNLENSDSKSEKTLFKNGLFGQKDPVIVSLLFFIFFILFVFIVMGIIHIFKNRTNIFSSIKTTATSGVNLVSNLRNSRDT